MSRWTLIHSKFSSNDSPMLVLKKPDGEVHCTYHKTIYGTWLMYMWGFPKQEFPTMISCVKNAEQKSGHSLEIEDYNGQ